MLSLVVAGLGLTSLCPASLLIYEGFNYAAADKLSTIKPNESTVGLDRTVAYAGTGVANYTVQNSSLTFGSLQTTGGSVSFGSGTNVASGKLLLSEAFSPGTLWSSYLVTLSTQGSNNGNGALMRISNDTANASERLHSFADSRTSGTQIGVGYDSTPTAATNTNGSNPLTSGTTYIIIARFTNVGSALTPSLKGDATAWALTEAQFSTFLAASNRETYLDTASVTATAGGVTAKVSDGSVSSGTFTLATGNFLAVVSVGDTGTFDELRYGTTLADVTPIPEPATVGLVAGIGILLLAARRKRRA